MRDRLEKEKDFGGIERLVTLVRLGGWTLASKPGRDFAKISNRFYYISSEKTCKSNFLGNPKSGKLL